jgi:hypothetical protein
MGSKSIRNFCKAEDISPATFYEMQREGKAPRVRTLGPSWPQKRLITDEDAAEWRNNLPVAPPPQPKSA